MVPSFPFKKLKWSVLLTAALVLCCSTTAFADYYISETNLDTQEMIDAYEPEKVIIPGPGQTQLNTPGDLFLAPQGDLYVADTKNNRIVVFSPAGEVIKVFEGSYGKDALPFNQPQGVFVDELGDVFVADTENGRIVHLDSNGAFVEEFLQPNDDAYDKTYAFKPVKVSIDQAGSIYAITEYDWHGAVVMNGNNEFLGYVGGSKVEYTLTDRLIRLFATAEQKEQLARETPPYFSNIFLRGGSVYATAYWEETAQIKRLTPAGENIYIDKAFGEMNENPSFNNLPGFIDVAVDENMIVYAADMITGKVYVYDQSGVNLAVFGGEGLYAGKFAKISSIVVDPDGRLYVLDSVSGVIQTFTPTALIKNLIQGTTLQYQGKYKEALEPWKQVRKLDPTNMLAYSGIAKAVGLAGEYENAFSYYRMAADKKGYSDLFGDYRLDFFRAHFGAVMLSALVILVTFSALVILVKRYADRACKTLAEVEKLGPKHYFKMGSLMLFHPLDCMEMIKANRKRISYGMILLLLFIYVVVGISNIYLIHFPFADVSRQQAGIGKQIALQLVPLLSWIVMGFAISAISDGKQTFKETAYTSLLSFLPYMLFTFPLAGISHLLSQNEGALFWGLQAFIMVWCVLLLLASNKVMNEYTMKTFIGFLLKTLFGIVCMWMIAVLFFNVFTQSKDLFESVYKEFQIIVNQ